MQIINFRIFFIICIVGVSLSQNIISSWHYDKVQMYDIQKIGTILQTQLKGKVKDLPEFTEDNIKISGLILADVQISLYDSYLNLNTGLYLFSPNKVTINFNFTYTSGKETGAASFDLKINTLKMRLKNNKGDQTQSIEITMTVSESDYVIFGITDKETAEKVKTALYKGFKDNQIINEKLISRIDAISYYKEFYNNIKPYTLKTGSFFNSKEIIINLNRFIGFCEDVKGKGETALCYYSGEIEEDKKDKSKVPLVNEEFVTSNETYNLFINEDLVNSVTKKIVSDGLSDKTYKEGTSSKQLTYDFTVSSLRKIFSGISSDFKDDDKFETRIHLNEITFNKASFLVSFNINDKENVFGIEVETEIKLNTTVIKTVRFNICLSSSTTTNVKVQSSSNIQINDELKLKEAIDNSFDYDKLPLCLTDSGVSLRDYFAVIKKASIADEGIYLQGDQLYQ